MFRLIQIHLFSVCTNKSQMKATVALIFQSIAIFILLAVIGFLIAFIIRDFTLCFGFQCDQTSTTFISTSNTTYFTYSSIIYGILKRVFIICELVCAVIFIIFSIIYIILFIKCLKQLPHIHPLKHALPTRSAVSNRLKSSASQSTQPISMLRVDYIQSDVRGHSHTAPSATRLSYNAQEICPKCQYISPYIPNEDVDKCSICDYRSHLVEHAQQW